MIPIRIKYGYSSGTMMRASFDIDVTPEEIVSVSYWPEDIDRDLTEEEHRPITKEQWADIEKIILILEPVLEEKKKNIIKPIDIPSLQVLDGGDKVYFYITWKDADIEKRIEYWWPQDRRSRTLDSLLKELAEPVGREIIWYDAPKLCGIYYSYTTNKRNKCSYQCTLKNIKDTEGERWYFSHSTVNGKEKSVSTTIYKDTWQIIADKLETVGIEKIPQGKKGQNAYCTLYFTDGKQCSVYPDKKMMNELKEFFETLNIF